MKDVLKTSFIALAIIPFLSWAGELTDKYQQFADKTIPEYCASEFVHDQEACKIEVDIILTEAFIKMVEDFNSSITSGSNQMQTRAQYQGLFAERIKNQCSDWADKEYDFVCAQYQRNYISTIFDYVQEDPRLPRVSFGEVRATPTVSRGPARIDCVRIANSWNSGEVRLKNSCARPIMAAITGFCDADSRESEVNKTFEIAPVSCLQFRYQPIFSPSCQFGRFRLEIQYQVYTSNPGSPDNCPSASPSPTSTQVAPVPATPQQTSIPQSNGGGGGTLNSPNTTRTNIDSAGCSMCMTQRHQSCDTTMQACEMNCSTTHSLPSESEAKTACRLRCASDTSSCKSGARAYCAGFCN